MNNNNESKDQEVAILKILEGMTVGEAKLLLSRIASNLELTAKVSAPS